MKKVILLVIAVVIASGAYAQSNKEDIDMIQAMYGKGKKELVATYMKFSKEDSDKFWPVYDAFENERKELGRQRIEIISDYAEHYSTLDDVKAADLGKRTLANSIAMEKLNEKYFSKFSAAIGALKAAKYMQVETYLQAAVRLEIQDNIPFIGEMDHLKQDVK